MHMESTAGHAAPFRTAQSIHPSAGGESVEAVHCGGGDAQVPAQLSALMAENRELRAEIERLRGERNRMNDVQTRIMELLGTKAPERLLHDLRNALNERELYRALADATT